MKYSVEYITEGDGRIAYDLSLSEAIDEIVNIATHLSEEDEGGDEYSILDENRNTIYTFTVERGDNEDETN